MQKLNKYPPNINLRDINAVSHFNKPIDILYLDGWDKGTPQYAENHLKAYETAKSKLAFRHLVLIDDTDFDTADGGKDQLLSPHLLEKNYHLLFTGRQTLFINQI